MGSLTTTTSIMFTTIQRSPVVLASMGFSGLSLMFMPLTGTPLTTISHILDCQFYGLQPWGHHLTNIVLHAAAAILLFLALRSLTANVWPSAFVATLFAIHPLRVESVAWISERKDVLSGVFFMLTLLAYARYARAAQGSFGKYITVAVFLALGLMCKPTLVTLPFVLLLLDYWPLARCHRSEIRSQKSAGRSQRSVVSGLVIEKIPLFVFSAASCVATVLAQEKALEKSLKLSFALKVANAATSYVAYLGEMFYPAKLAVLYPYRKPAPAEVVLSLLSLGIVSVIFLLWRKKYPFPVDRLALVPGDARSYDWPCPGRSANTGRSLHLLAPDRLVYSGDLGRDGFIHQVACRA